MNDEKTRIRDGGRREAAERLRALDVTDIEEMSGTYGDGHCGAVGGAVAAGAYSADPRLCPARGSSFYGTHAFCSLMGAWGTCLRDRCYVQPDGRLVEPDNSDEAKRKRMEAMR